VSIAGEPVRTPAASGLGWPARGLPEPAGERNVSGLGWPVHTQEPELVRAAAGWSPGVGREAAAPEAAAPEATRPGAAQPEATRPGAAQPEAVRPEAVQGDQLPGEPAPRELVPGELAPGESGPDALGAGHPNGVGSTPHSPAPGFVALESQVASGSQPATAADDFTATDAPSVFGPDGTRRSAVDAAPPGVLTASDQAAEDAASGDEVAGYNGAAGEWAAGDEVAGGDGAAGGAVAGGMEAHDAVAGDGAAGDVGAGDDNASRAERPGAEGSLETPPVQRSGGDRVASQSEQGDPPDQAPAEALSANARAAEQSEPTFPAAARSDAPAPVSPFAAAGSVGTAEDYSVVPHVSRETEDTPIARAAETAVRVLAGRVGESLPTPPQTRVLTVANQKGGVGKTTTTVNLAAALALQGAQILVLDLDPQGNASTALGVPHHAGIPSIYDVLIEGRPLEEVVVAVDGIAGLWCAPATIDLAGAEIELVSLVARESRLLRALSAYLARHPTGQPRLDYVLIDCPPSLGLLTVNALVAAPEVLIPIQCEYYALEGVTQLLSNVEMVRSHLNPALHVSTVLLTMYDARTRLAAQVAHEVRKHFVTTVLRTTIPRSVRISEAPSYGQTVMTYDPGSTGALSYLEAAREMALRGAVAPSETTKETT
jgi:chromosome partitioning protein